MRKTKANQFLFAALSLALVACAAELGEGEIEGDLDGGVDEEELDELESIATPNLVLNPGFESQTCAQGVYCSNNWYIRGAFREKRPHSGSYSLFGLETSQAMEAVRIVGDRTYVASAWYRHHYGSDSQRMRVRVVNSSGAVLFQRTIWGGTSSTWHRISTSFYAPPNAYRVWIVLEDHNSVYSMGNWDDISLRGYY